MSKKAKQEDAGPKKKSLYTIKLTEEQLDALHKFLKKQLWESYDVDYARFAYKGDKVNVVGYESGKLVVQGKGTEDFVTYILEGEITQTPLLGYEEVHHPEWFELHAGLDESGKGDLFGPLVSCCVIADGNMVREWMEAGIKDSKRITSDKAIMAMEKVIRNTEGVVIKTTFAGMRKYNELYHKFGSNLNKLLAWMHAKALEEALKEKKAPWGMLDQFSKQPLVQKYFEGTDFDLRMMTKAEADPVVAAASIIARATYVRQMKKLEDLAGQEIPKGASARVKEVGRAIVEKHGEDALADYAKMHFKTAYEILGKEPPIKKKYGPA